MSYNKITIYFRGDFMAMSQLEKELYHRYSHIKSRCYNTNDKRYPRYGGRGITMCDEWFSDFYSFKNWATENGYRKELSIDRIDNDGPYSPENCRWVTLSENNQNRSSSTFYTYNDKTQNLMQWCNELGLNYNTILMRIRRGWSFEKAITSKKRERDTKTLIGKRFGELTVIEFVGKDKYRKSIFRCKCNCGNETVLPQDKLISGHTSSCGCLRKNKRKHLSKV